MQGLPVTIRLLDPPLHEFLPSTEAEMAEVAKAAGTDVAALKPAIASCTKPIRCLAIAAAGWASPIPKSTRCRSAPSSRRRSRLSRKPARPSSPEIMIPLVGTKKELDLLKEVVDRIGGRGLRRHGTTLEYLVGTMIELPRAALTAGRIAESAAFFSFGTNDLTQTTLGMSRDDFGPFLDVYRQKGILEHDPFASLDQEGVGELVHIAVERGREDPARSQAGHLRRAWRRSGSIAFCQKVGLDYVSCSPYRVPIARLAAAQAALGMHSGTTA